MQPLHQLPPAISASVCRKFLQRIFYICQEFLNIRVKWREQINGDSIKMFIIKTCTPKIDQFLLSTFSHCTKREQKLVQSQSRHFIASQKYTSPHGMLKSTQTVDLMMRTPDLQHSMELVHYKSSL